MLGQSKTSTRPRSTQPASWPTSSVTTPQFAAADLPTQPASPPGEFNFLDHSGLEGFVLAITPFNFTAIGGNLPTIPALMGNTVVWKPSEKSALATEVSCSVLTEAGLPPGVINKVHGAGAAIAAKARGAQQFAGLNFTGSTAVLRDLWAKIGSNVGELPQLPADRGRDRRQERGRRAPLGRSRRRCSSRSPVERSSSRARSARPRPAPTCPRSLWTDLEGRLGDTVGQFVVGDPTRHETFLGAVIDETSLRRLESTIDHGQGTDRAPHPHRRHRDARRPAGSSTRRSSSRRTPPRS